MSVSYFTDLNLTQDFSLKYVGNFPSPDFFLYFTLILLQSSVLTLYLTLKSLYII